jgi:hypothetical protein
MPGPSLAPAFEPLGKHVGPRAALQPSGSIRLLYRYRHDAFASTQVDRQSSVPGLATFDPVPRDHPATKGIANVESLVPLLDVRGDGTPPEKERWAEKEGDAEERPPGPGLTEGVLCPSADNHALADRRCGEGDSGQGEQGSCDSEQSGLPPSLAHRFGPLHDPPNRPLRLSPREPKASRGSNPWTFIRDCYAVTHDTSPGVDESMAALSLVVNGS